jgi:hypothetical protein
MPEKVCTIVIITSLIVLSVAADWLVQTGIHDDRSAARSDVIAVHYDPAKSPQPELFRK